MTVKELIDKLSEGSLNNEVRIFSATDEMHDEEFHIESVEPSVGGFASTQIILTKE